MLGLKSVKWYLWHPNKYSLEKVRKWLPKFLNPRLLGTSIDPYAAETSLEEKKHKFKFKRVKIKGCWGNWKYLRTGRF